MKILRKRFILITILFSIFLVYLFFLIFPLVFVGVPTALFYVQNEDDMAHNVFVNIVNEQNMTVFNTSYFLHGNESIYVDRELRWNVPFPSTFVTWSDGEYTFHFTVDNNVSDQIARDINQYESVSVDIESNQNQSEKIDIIIKILTV